MTQEKFGEYQGKDVTAYTLTNNNGYEVTCLDYGCIISKLLVPDQNGTFENVVLGFDRLEDYHNYSSYFGATIGRVAGRIDKAAFQLDGETYKLPVNDGQNHLHGGHKGFDKVIWDTRVIDQKDKVGLEFSYFSPDGEEGYPGNLRVKVIYMLNDLNEFSIAYEGEADQTTLLNLTNHTYFNLSGHLKRDVLNHYLTMDASAYLPLTKQLIPMGKLASVENTDFDFRKRRQIISGAQSNHEQNILAGNGYDHPFVLNTNHQQEIVLEDRESGRNLVVETDEPCVVLYTGNQLGDDFSIRGVQSKKYLGLCLETQKHPDAINHPSFPSIVLKQGDVYQSTTTYSFNINI